jgi:hypothetical protein
MTASKITKRAERDFHLLAIAAANMIVLADDLREIIAGIISTASSFFGG